MNAPEQHTVRLSSGDLTYTLTRKRVKNINLRVHPDGRVSVSAPPRVPLSFIEAFLKEQETFFQSAARRREAALSRRPKPLTLAPGEQLPVGGVFRTVCLSKAEKNAVCLTDDVLILSLTDPADAALRARVFGAFIKREADRVLTEKAHALYPLFAPRPAAFPALKFRTMKTKWGVCRPAKNQITLNRNLLFLPPDLIDYVICHELTHFRHPDHSPAFWQDLSRFVPDCKEKRKALSDFPVPVFDDLFTRSPRSS